MDSSKASKLASKLNDILYDFEESADPKKRKNGDDSSENTSKRPKFEEGIKENVDQKPPLPQSGESDGGAEAPPPVISSEKIKEMMANAQKVIEEKKRLLEAQGIRPPAGAVGGPVRMPTPGNPFVARQPRAMGPGFGGGKTVNSFNKSYIRHVTFFSTFQKSPY